MKQVVIVLLVAALVGCTANKAALPSFEGKPRIKINQRALVPADATPLIIETTGE